MRSLAGGKKSNKLIAEGQKIKSLTTEMQAEEREDMGQTCQVSVSIGQRLRARQKKLSTVRNFFSVKTVETKSMI